MNNQRHARARRRENLRTPRGDEPRPYPIVDKD